MVVNNVPASISIENTIPNFLILYWLKQSKVYGRTSPAQILQLIRSAKKLVDANGDIEAIIGERF